MFVKQRTVRSQHTVSACPAVEETADDRWEGGYGSGDTRAGERERREDLGNHLAGSARTASPCASWQVRDVVNHIVGNNFWFEAIARDGVAPDRPNNAAPDETASDYVGRFGEGSASAVAAFGAAMDTTLTLPWGPMPASVFIVMASADQFVHGWDLAKATGQSTDLDPALAAEFLEFYRGRSLTSSEDPTRSRHSGHW